MPLAQISYEEIEDPGLDRKFFYELLGDCGNGDCCRIIEDRKLKFYRLKVQGGNGYVRIRYSGDCGQLYCNGELFDDNYYTGGDWVVQAEALDGRECVIVISEYLHNLYVEVEPKTTCDIHEIVITTN